MDKPVVLTAVFTYNHEAYIEQCLQSVLEQTGEFTIRVIVFDDASTDSTQSKVNNFLRMTAIPPHILFEYRRSPINRGMVVSLRETIRTCEQMSADYFTILDGDDFWLPGRVQKHIDFLEQYQEVVLSFNQFRFLDQETQQFTPYKVQEELHGTFFNAHELAAFNFIGNISCAFVRHEYLKKIPNALFEFFAGDRMLHIWLAQYGVIGYVEEVLSVHRKHGASIWTGKSMFQQSQILFESIQNFNRLTNYVFDKEFQIYVRQLYLTSVFDKIDLAIIDDVFPTTLSPFRYEEFCGYLDAIPNVRCFCDGLSLPHLTDIPNEKIITQFKKSAPQYADQIVNWSGFDFPSGLSAKLAYFCFSENAYRYVHAVERVKVPFVFELYPGGGFALNNPVSDEKLCAVFSSPYFCKVIVTQRIVKDYLIENGFCSEDKILSVFGVVTPRGKLETKQSGIYHYGLNKSRLDICFVAFRYTRYGEDKGYDVFIEAAKLLVLKHDNVFFHVVGSFDAQTIDVTALGERITFYGRKPPEWFPQFYADKDIILSPNIHGKLNPGAFDGFPTAACTEAALCETAIFCTDPLALNDGNFIPGEDMVIVEHDAVQISDVVSYYHHHPKLLEQLAVRGKEKVQRIYSYEKQMTPRIAMLRQEILDSKRKEVEILQKYGATLNVHPFAVSTLFCDVGGGFSEENKITGSINWFDNHCFSVWFFLPDHVKAVRFDPTEMLPVKCKEITATCCNIPVGFSPAYSVKKEGWDCFLSSDPQYISERLSEKAHGVLKIQGEIVPLQVLELQQIVGELLSAAHQKKLPKHRWHW